VPAIAVATNPRDLWSVAAVLHAPPVSAWLWRRRAGTALSRDALSVSAGDVESLPLPPDGAEWQRGAAAAERAWRSAAEGDGAGWAEALRELGRAMCAAYGVGDAVLEWWADRLPAFR
jgi:hypothetical protein